MGSIKNNNNKLKDYFYIKNNNDEDLKRNENEATTKLKIKIKKSLNNNNVNTPIRPTTASVIITPRDTEDIKKSNLKKMYFFRFYTLISSFYYTYHCSRDSL